MGARGGGGEWGLVGGGGGVKRAGFGGHVAGCKARVPVLARAHAWPGGGLCCATEGSSTYGSMWLGAGGCGAGKRGLGAGVGGLARGQVAWCTVCSPVAGFVGCTDVQCDGGQQHVR